MRACACICEATFVARCRRRGVCQTQTEDQIEVVLADGMLPSGWLFSYRESEWGPGSHLGRARWNVSIKFDCLAIICCCCWLAGSWQPFQFVAYPLSLFMSPLQESNQDCPQLLLLLLRLWRLPAAICHKSFAHKAKVFLSLSARRRRLIERLT